MRRSPLAQRLPAPATAGLALGLAAHLVVAACKRDAPPPAQQAEPAADTAARELPPAPPPAPRLSVSPRDLYFDAVGDVAALTLWPDGVSCSSDEEAVATVDEAGAVTSRGNGETRIRCRLGGAARSVSVIVNQEVVRVAVRSDRGFTLQPGDSAQLTLARADRRGAAVAEGVPTFVSLAPDLVRVDSITGRVWALGVGAAPVVGRLGALADTVPIEVVTQAVAAAPAAAPRPVRVLPATQRGAVARGALRPGVPAGQTARAGLARQDLARETMRRGARVGVREPAALDSILSAQAASAAPSQAAAALRWSISASGVLQQAEHHASEQGEDENAGLMFGALVQVQAMGRLSARAHVLRGTLGVTTGTGDESVADAAAELGYAALPWLTFLVGGNARSYKDEVTQGVNQFNWQYAGAEAQSSLGGTALSGTLRLVLSPFTQVVGTIEKPNFVIASAVGLDYAAGRISAGVHYLVERYGFPSSGGTQRKEQFSALRFRLGLMLAR